MDAKVIATDIGVGDVIAYGLLWMTVDEIKPAPWGLSFLGQVYRSGQFRLVQLDTPIDAIHVRRRTGPVEPVLPDWVKALIEPLGVEFIVFGKLLIGSADNTIWACNGDCSCWFIVDDGMYLDRYSFVNEGGWCQGQHCECHDLPPRVVRPGSEADFTIEP